MTDVLIAGAGPTGLMLACELARAGVSFRVVDKVAEPNLRSRALVVHARTLELFQKLGVDRDLIARGRKTATAHVFVNKQHAAKFEIGDTGIDDTPFPFMLFVSQAETERVLAEHLIAAGVTIERSTEVTRVDATLGAVTLHHASGRDEIVSPRFVVGCDGAHSVVRHAGKFAFEGEPYPQDFVLADIHLREPLPEMNMFFDDRGVFVILPLADALYRIIAMRSDAPMSAADPTLADVQALADALSPIKLALVDPIWLARFRLHHRQVDHYRRGRLFLAGDAAHIHSPAGGQGMNTGIQDAANLAWKMALVLRGEAGDSLLDSYHEERHPVGRELLRTTDRMFALNTTGEQWMKALRNFAVRHLAERVLSSRERRAWIFRFIAELKIAYTESSIVHGDAHGPKAGTRAPDAPLDDGDEMIFARTRDHAHHLLVFSRDRAKAEAFATEARKNRWIRAHAITTTRAEIAAERYGVRDEALFLIRPDGYIGMSAPSLDASALTRYAERIELRSSH